MAASFRPGMRLAAALFMALIVVGGCASAASPVSQDAANAPAREPLLGAASAAGGVGSIGAPTAGPAAPPEGADAQAPDQGVDAGTQPLVVKTGSLNLETSDLASALVKGRNAIAAMGGYVSASDQANKGDATVASITYRIPAARWDDALDALQKIATKVLAEQTSAVEVTGQVLDLGARITNLQATEQALQAIMAKATRISDVLEVQQQLTDVRGQIEQLSTEKAHLEQQAAYGNLTVLWTVPVVPAVTVAAKGWDPGVEVDHAAASLVGIGQAIATAAIWLGIVGVPALLIVLVVLVPLVVLFRRFAPRPRQPGEGWGAPGQGGTSATPV
jgi:hypothetical protein